MKHDRGAQDHPDHVRGDAGGHLRHHVGDEELRGGDLGKEDLVPRGEDSAEGVADPWGVPDLSAKREGVATVIAHGYSPVASKWSILAAATFARCLSVVALANR